MGAGRECPSCHRVNLPTARTCEECAFDLINHRPGRQRRGGGVVAQPGVVGLAMGTIIHPVNTMDSFFYYVSDSAMLGKMVLFYLISLPVAGFVTGGGEMENWVQGTVAEAAGFVVSTLCIIGAGRLLGQSGSILGAGVILGFVRAVVSLVLGLYVLGVVIGLMPFNLLVMLVFLIWNIVLNIVALTNIFGCSASVAFFISIIAGILHAVVSRAIGVPT